MRVRHSRFGLVSRGAISPSVGGGVPLFLRHLFDRGLIYRKGVAAGRGGVSPANNRAIAAEGPLCSDESKQHKDVTCVGYSRQRSSKLADVAADLDPVSPLLAK